MKQIANILLTLGILLFSFGYWGYFTQSGSNCFDEMSGMIPFFALAGSVLIILIAVILKLIHQKNKRRL